MCLSLSKHPQPRIKYKTVVAAPLEWAGGGHGSLPVGVTCKCCSESHLLSSISSVFLCFQECSGKRKKAVTKYTQNPILTTEEDGTRHELPFILFKERVNSPVVQSPPPRLEGCPDRLGMSVGIVLTGEVWESPAHCGDTIPGAGALGGIRKAAEHEPVSEATAAILHGFCFPLLTVSTPSLTLHSPPTGLVFSSHSAHCPRPLLTKTSPPSEAIT